jgi:cation/acetate symporter
MSATIVLSLFVLGKIGWNPIDIFDRAQAQSDDGAAYLAPGLNFTNPIDTISLGLALLLGTAGLPHILMRFFTVPDAKAARSSVVWAVGLIGAFYVMTTFLGFGARALLGESGTTGSVDEAGNLAAPLLAQTVGGGAGSIGGDAFLAIIAAVAFATILAVVAGLVISASGAVAHDVWSNVIRKGRDSEHEEVNVARVAAFAIGAISIAIAIAGGSDLNVSYMVGLAFAVAASANFPALLLALTWRRFNTTGAVTGVLLGTVSSVGLVLLGPDVASDPLIELTQPAIISVPLGFIGCILGSLLSREETKAERGFDELYVRAETGLGAEVPISAGPAPEREEERERELTGAR